MKKLVLTISLLFLPITSVFAVYSLPISKGTFYEQAVCQNLVHPKISVSTYNESVRYSSSNSVYVQVDMIVSTDGGSYNCTDSQNRYHRQNVFFAWRASTGKFTDITAGNAKPFSTMRWSGTIRRGSQHKIKAYVGNALGSLVSQNIIVDDTGVKVITDSGRPELSVSTFSIATSTRKNQETNARVVIANTGTKASASTSGSIYFSNDRFANPNDTKIGQFAISAITSKGNRTINRLVKLPASGSKWVFACVTPVADEQDKSFSSHCSTPKRITVTEPPAAQVAKITSPANNATLTSGTVTFQWTKADVSYYLLRVGTRPFGHDIFNGTVSRTSTSKTLNNLPINGRKLYVTLWSRSRSDRRWRNHQSAYATKNIKQLKSLGVFCPSNVIEGKNIYCKATAYYTDNSREDVTRKVSWSENSSFARFYPNGRLYAQSVYGTQRNARVTARYTINGITKARSRNVTLKTKPKQLKSLRVFCPTSVVEGSSANCSARAYYTDNSNENVTSKASWSENSPYARIYAGGRLRAYSVRGKQRGATVTARYKVNGVTKIHTDYVTLKVKAKQLKSLTVSCPNSVVEDNNGYCRARAYFTDNSSTDVTSKVSWSDNSSFATVYSNGRLRAKSLYGRQRTVGVTAKYTANGVTKVRTDHVSLKIKSKKLKSLKVSCPSGITEGRSTYCQARAYFTDNSSADVTRKVSWSDNSGYARVYSNGRLRTYYVRRDQWVNIKATYSVGGIRKQHNDYVKIRNR